MVSLDLLSLDEVAKALRVSIHTVRARSYQKRFPIVKLGRRVLIRREDMERFVQRSLLEAKED